MGDEEFLKKTGTALTNLVAVPKMDFLGMVGPIHDLGSLKRENRQLFVAKLREFPAWKEMKRRKDICMFIVSMNNPSCIPEKDKEYPQVTKEVHDTFVAACKKVQEYKRHWELENANNNNKANV